MKLFIVPVFALYLAAIGCAESADTPVSNAHASAVSQAMHKVEAKVEGMHCTVVCGPEVQEAAMSIAGVEDAYADVETGTVTLALTDDADAAAVIKAFKAKIPALADGGKYTVGATREIDEAAQLNNQSPPANRG